MQNWATSAKASRKSGKLFSLAPLVWESKTAVYFLPPPMSKPLHIWIGHLLCTWQVEARHMCQVEALALFAHVAKLCFPVNKRQIQH